MEGKDVMYPNTTYTEQDEKTPRGAEAVEEQPNYGQQGSTEPGLDETAYANNHQAILMAMPGAKDILKFVNACQEKGFLGNDTAEVGLLAEVLSNYYTKELNKNPASMKIYIEDLERKLGNYFNILKSQQKALMGDDNIDDDNDELIQKTKDSAALIFKDGNIKHLTAALKHHAGKYLTEIEKESCQNLNNSLLKHLQDILASSKGQAGKKISDKTKLYTAYTTLLHIKPYFFDANMLSVAKAVCIGVALAVIGGVFGAAASWVVALTCVTATLVYAGCEIRSHYLSSLTPSAGKISSAKEKYEQAVNDDISKYVDIIRGFIDARHSAEFVMTNEDKVKFYIAYSFLYQAKNLQGINLYTKNKIKATLGIADSLNVMSSGEKSMIMQEGKGETMGYANFSNKDLYTVFHNSMLAIEDEREKFIDSQYLKGYDAEEKEDEKMSLSLSDILDFDDVDINNTIEDKTNQSEKQDNKGIENKKENKKSFTESLKFKKDNNQGPKINV